MLKRQVWQEITQATLRGLVLAAAVLALLSSTMTAQNSATETARQAFRAVAQRDWRNLANLIDPEALDSLRQDALGMLILTSEQRLAGETAEGGYNPGEVVIADHLPRVGGQRFPGFRDGPTISELAQLSPVEFFIAWAQAAYGDEPGTNPQRDVAGLFRTIIGEVVETPDIAYVVYRREERYWVDGEFKVALPGRVRILSLIRRENRWRIRFFNEDIGWSIDFSDVVFYDQRPSRTLVDVTLPHRVAPTEPEPPSLERIAVRPTPQEVTDSALRAFEAGDWVTYARFVAPDALQSFQQEQLAFFVAHVRMREAYANAKRKGLGIVYTHEDSLTTEEIAASADLEIPLKSGTQRLGALAKLSPGDFLAEWLRAAYGSNSGEFGNETRGMQRTTIGQVFEGETLAHVLYRETFHRDPERMALRWSEAGWRIGLTQEMMWFGEFAFVEDDP